MGNGKRGVVDRCDPRPAAKGRWEIEVRLPGGITETKSLKRKLAVNDTSRQILGKLRPRDALGILDKIDASRIGDVNEYVATQVSLMLDLSDSDDDRPSKRLRE